MVARNKTASRNGAIVGNGAVLYEKRDGIAWVTLNRPDRLQRLQRRDARRSVRCAERRPRRPRRACDGAGGRGSGVFHWRRRQRVRTGALAHSPLDGFASAATFGAESAALPIPTIAAVHGFTVGGGLEMALLCDLAIAAEDTRFCLPETSLGMIPGVAGTQTAPRRLGLGWALDLNITGRWIDARRGFVYRFGRRSRAAHSAGPHRPCDGFRTRTPAARACCDCEDRGLGRLELVAGGRPRT